jgi:hypothetical protein
MVLCCPERLSDTVCAVPLTNETVTEYVVDCPAVIVLEDGETEMLKLKGGGVCETVI